MSTSWNLTWNLWSKSSLASGKAELFESNDWGSIWPVVSCSSSSTELWDKNNTFPNKKLPTTFVGIWNCNGWRSFGINRFKRGELDHNYWPSLYSHGQRMVILSLWICRTPNWRARGVLYNYSSLIFVTLDLRKRLGLPASIIFHDNLPFFFLERIYRCRSYEFDGR